MRNTIEILEEHFKNTIEILKECYDKNKPLCPSMEKRQEEEKHYQYGQKFKLFGCIFMLFVSIGEEGDSENTSKFIDVLCIESCVSKDYIGKLTGNRTKVGDFRNITIEELDKIFEGESEHAELIED